MNDDLKQRSVELLKEAGESAFQMTLWLLNGLLALLELAGWWVGHILARVAHWLADTGVPMTVAYSKYAARLLIDFSIVSVNLISVSAVSIAGFARSAVDSRTG